jgi:hypothetical protein
MRLSAASFSVLLSGLACQVAADFNIFQNVDDVFDACASLSTSCDTCTGGTSQTAPVDGIPGSPPNIFAPGPFTITGLCGSQPLDFYYDDPNQDGGVGVYMHNAFPPDVVATCVENVEPITCGKIRRTEFTIQQVFQCTSSRVCPGS